MCGLMGHVGNAIETDEFKKLNELSGYRGPDSSMVYHDINISLGFNRLSIIDTSSAGQQPMTSNDGRWTLVFNGEIYNHQSLPAVHNYPFIGHSDSESILASLANSGFPDTVASLNGMFAIAAWDAKEKKLWLARDYAGIKPLFYGISKQGLVFASQFNQVYLHSSFRDNLELIPEEVKAYFSLGYLQAPGTVYRNIFQIRPGELISYHLPTHKLTSKFFKEYEWKVPYRWKETENELVNAFENAFEETIQDQLVSDVPLGVFLSGGIDSPLVAAFAHQCRPDIVAYTIGSGDVDTDESKTARKYADAMGIQHIVRKFRAKDLLKVVDDHFLRMGEPFADYSSLPTYLVSQIAAEDNKVMLSGDGGDELFWGYPRFQNTVQHSAWFHIPKWVRKIPAYILRKTGQSVSYAVNVFDKPQNWIFDRQMHQTGGLINEAFGSISFPNYLEKLYTPSIPLHNKEDLLHFLRWNEFYAHLQRVLIKVDRASMANSLEVRVPFLDKRIIDLAWRIQPELGMSHQVPKLILRKALAKKVGLQNVTSGKKGFGIPIRQWLRHELKEEVTDLLLGSKWYGSECFDDKPMRLAVEQFIYHDQGNEWGIWIMYAWQKWGMQMKEARQKFELHIFP